MIRELQIKMMDPSKIVDVLRPISQLGNEVPRGPISIEANAFPEAEAYGGYETHCKLCEPIGLGHLCVVLRRDHNRIYFA